MTDFYDDDCCGTDEAEDAFDLMNGDGQGDPEEFYEAYYSTGDSYDSATVDTVDEPSIVTIANGAGYPAGGYASLPVSGDTAALMQQLDGQLAMVRQLGDISDLGSGVTGAPAISGSVQNTLDLLHNTYNASPATLNWLNGMANAESSYREVSNEVYKYDQTH